MTHILSNIVRGSAPALTPLALGACASNPVPDEKIAVAQAAVQHAVTAGAPQLAPVDLSAAQDELREAQAAAAKHRGADAIALAERANVDAAVAEATAQEKRSHQAASELDSSLEALRRNAGASSSSGTGGTAPANNP